MRRTWYSRTYGKTQSKKPFSKKYQGGLDRQSDHPERVALNEEQYNQVCEACDQLLKLPGSTLERVSIPWLHVIREHPSFLKSYKRLFTTSVALDGGGKAMVAKARTFAGWIRQWWKALQSDGAPWHASRELSGPVDILFVSHLLNLADAGKSTDFYFGNLPELIQAEGRRVAIALIDHAGFLDATAVCRWDGGAAPRVLLSSTLDLRGELTLYRRLKRESLRLAKLSRREASSFLKKVCSVAAGEAMSGSARATLRMSLQISYLVTTLKPKMVVVTYEGHAWERVAFAAAREASAGVQCVGYQHAAIFRLQHAALRKLGFPFDPDLILAAGVVSKTQIENSAVAQGIAVHILGSNRAFSASEKGASRPGAGDSGAGPDDVFLDACLVLPEGIASECILLFEFSLNCAKLMPEMRFIWRLHPLITPESLMALNPSMRELPPNVEFSRISLEDDFKRTSFALYRGSTAIVKAVIFGLQPIYLVNIGEMTIDPLYQMDALRTKVTEPSDFQAAIHIGKTVPDAELSQKAVARYCDAFYSPVEPAVILSMLT
jgi:hypothetical protein